MNHGPMTAFMTIATGMHDTGDGAAARNVFVITGDQGTMMMIVGTAGAISMIVGADVAEDMIEIGTNLYSIKVLLQAGLFLWYQNGNSQPGDS